MLSKKVKGKIHTLSESPFGKHLCVSQIALAEEDLG